MSFKTQKDKGKNAPDALGTEDENLSLMADILSAFNADICPTERRNSQYLRSRIKTQDDAFAAIDPLLRDLRKELKSIKAQYEQTQEVFGAEDEMTDVLADQLDSAYCAVETRLLEVKQDRVKCARGLQVWQRVLEEQGERDKLAKKKRRDREIELYNAWYTFSRDKKKGAFLGWLWVLLLLYVIHQNNQRQMKNNLDKKG